MVHGVLSHRTHTPHDQKKALLTIVLYNIIIIISSEIFVFRGYILIFNAEKKKTREKYCLFFTIKANSE